MAAALSALDQPAAGRASQQWTVDVTGGRLSVDIGPDQVRLTGPAVVVATGALDEAWLTAAASTQQSASEDHVEIAIDVS
ncbi:MAG: hypothetical protein WCB04_12775 [Mycobacteriales bacterium]